MNRRSPAVLAVAFGALGIVFTSACYALSPVAAALPHPTVPGDAIAETLRGAFTMRLAGVVGMPADVLFAAGAALVAWRALSESRPGLALGWALAGFASLVFVVVDGLVGAVLPDVARDAPQSYLGFRRLFDALFASGTLAFGVGALLVALGSTRAHASMPWRAATTIAAIGALVSAPAFFVGIDSAQGLGLSIALGSVAFAWWGLRPGPTTPTTA